MERRQNIGLQVGKDYTLSRILEAPGGMEPAIRITDSNGKLQRFPMKQPGSPVAGQLA